MSPELLVHQLCLAVRPVDHFSREPVPDELPLRLAGTFQRPVPRPGGGGCRQHDGAYRFINVPAGATRILWRRPLARSHGAWVRWADDPMLTLPLAKADAFVDVDLWPAAHAGVPPAATAVRGRLTGPSVAGQTVRIALQGETFDRFTRSDDNGDFLFLPPGRLPLDAAGRVPLSIDVQAPGGAARALAGGRFVPADTGSAFAGPDFTVLPRIASRVLFQLL